MRGEGGKTGFDDTRSRTREMDAAVGAAKEEGVARPLFEGAGEKKEVRFDDEPLGVEGVGERSRPLAFEAEDVEVGVPACSSSRGRLCSDLLRSMVRGPAAPVDGVARRFPCDLLLLSVGLVAAVDGVEGVIGTGLRIVAPPAAPGRPISSLGGGLLVACSGVCIALAVPRKSLLEVVVLKLTVRVRTRSRAAVEGAGGGPFLSARGARST